jgi:hypothetical protein
MVRAVGVLRRKFSLEQVALFIAYRFLYTGRQRYKGLWLVPAVRGREGKFIGLMKAAIDLLQATDTARYGRLLRNVGIIADKRTGTSWYLAAAKIIESNIAAYPPSFDPCSYCASVLVHESTHGMLYSRTEANGTEDCWVRHERLCHRAAALFVKKLPHCQSLAKHLTRLSKEYRFDGSELDRLFKSRKPHA